MATHFNILAWRIPWMETGGLRSVCVCAYSVAQSCSTIYNPMDCSPLGSSVHGILQARVLEGVAISFSRGSFKPRDRTRVSYVSYTGRRVPYRLCHQGTLEIEAKEGHCRRRGRGGQERACANLTEEFLPFGL